MSADCPADFLRLFFEKEKFSKFAASTLDKKLSFAYKISEKRTSFLR